MATRCAAQPRVRANKGVASIVPLRGAAAAATFDVDDFLPNLHGANRAGVGCGDPSSGRRAPYWMRHQRRRREVASKLVSHCP
jgi:hypothetical protein